MTHIIGRAKLEENTCSICGAQATNFIVNEVAISAPKGVPIKIQVKGKVTAEDLDYRCDEHFGFDYQR